MKIAHFAVNRRVAVSMIALAIVVLGFFAIPRLPVALLPHFTPPVVSVSVTYPNVGPQQMESLVTRPIENAVSRVNGIQQINSTSSEGSTEVRAQFYYGTNLDTAAVDVQEQVDRIRNQLPNDPNLQQPQISKFDSTNIPIVRMYVTDPNMTLRHLGDLFTNQLADQFASVNGVAAVTVNSDQQRAILIEPDSTKLAGYGLSLTQITSRVAQENINIPAGIIRVGPNEYQVRSNALLQSAAQIGSLVLATKNGSPIHISDVAKVTDAISEQRSYQRINGKPAMGVSINSQPDANVVTTSIGVYQKVNQIQSRYPGMNIRVVFDQQGFIDDAINALEHTAIYGAVLAIVIILLFLHSWRTTLIVAISLPISVLGTLFVAFLAGYSLNIMTLGGLALAVGLIVDDAIVVIENIYRHMARGQTPRDAAESGTGEIFSAVIASSITVFTVFVPLVLIPGLQGLIFTPFAVMVMAAVAISFVVAVTTVPMLATVLIRNKYGTNGQAHTNGSASKVARAGAYARFCAAFDHVYERFAAWYTRQLTYAVDHPKVILSAAGIILAATLIVVKLGAVQTDTFPASNSRYVRFNIHTPTGTSVANTNATSKIIEQRMLKDPRVLSVGAQVGTSGFNANGTGRTNQGNLSVSLKPSVAGDAATLFVSQWMAALTGSAARGHGSLSQASIAKFRQRYGGPIPGLRIYGRTIDIVQNVMSHGQDALTVQIYGPDVNTLFQIATNSVVPKLSLIPGLQAPNTSITNAQPELDIAVNRTKAAQLGLSSTAIANVIDTGTSGTIASYLQLNGTQYPIIVQLPPDQRRSLQAIENLGIPVSSTTPISNITQPASGGGTNSFTLPTLPLSEVAAITFGSGPSEIDRQDKQREIDIDAGLNGVPLGAAVTEATKVMNSISLPAGYYWTFGSGVTQNSDTFSSLILVVLLAIILIYMLLASQFESILHPLVIMVAIPLASTGVVLALFVTHRAFGLTAFIGVLMLVGIAVKNAILVVEFTNQLRERGYSARDAVLHAAPMRLRPILMTTLATVGGMTPIAIGLEAGSQTQAPLGTVVIGGLLVSTMLSLIVVPTLYLWVATHLEPRMGGFQRGKAKKVKVLTAELAPAEV